MATLANVTKDTRLILRYGGAALVVLVLIFLLFKGGAFLKDTFFPKPPDAAQEKFGKLLPIIFPQQTGNIPEFSVNTVSGVLPAFSSTIPVYKLIAPLPSITSLQTAKGKAGNLGYTQNQKTLTPQEYSWSMATANNTLRYNIVSFHFSVNSDYLVNPSPLGNVSDKDALLKTIVNFIGALGADQSDIDLGSSAFSYYTIRDGQLIEASNEVNASIARVYLIQKPVEKLPIYYPTTNPSLLYFTLSGANVVDASYTHFTPDLTAFSTYPLKTADAALQDLSSGKGFIVNPTADSVVDITDVSLGYYLGNEENQTYLMPIVVFTGKNNFKAYVNAIAD